MLNKLCIIAELSVPGKREDYICLHSFNYFVLPHCKPENRPMHNA
jgi:hypothetical protein